MVSQKQLRFLVSGTASTEDSPKASRAEKAHGNEVVV
eukprot:CAMPEP_0203898942 /NCGR_PEP_ID=MMETSP0359-20131031/41417_1 /ASSEMBLY_ACC=CAM_ASM_000338 /TAXON_ID=268821 /ORGANISM="Scrippsiella Hangoei, Strain SHTV-5" /LENGTH=36 /DNA_ID= /DNA_START= /DNA_END= /DNA_ORIENTATION=